MELADKDIKKTSINIFYMFKQVEENINIRWETSKVLKKQIEFLDVKIHDLN